LPRSVRFLLHVHDEIVMEAPESIAEEILKVSKQLLEKPLSWFSVPLIADGGVGSNWAQAKGA
jgi:DNA polymerase I-like protein with 3'-5' exonuclease and polymerase domains